MATRTPPTPKLVSRSTNFLVVAFSKLQPWLIVKWHSFFVFGIGNTTCDFDHKLIMSPVVVAFGFLSLSFVQVMSADDFDLTTLNKDDDFNTDFVESFDHKTFLATTASNEELDDYSVVLIQAFFPAFVFGVVVFALSTIFINQMRIDVNSDSSRDDGLLFTLGRRKRRWAINQLSARVMEGLQPRY